MYSINSNTLNDFLKRYTLPLSHLHAHKAFTYLNGSNNIYRRIQKVFNPNAYHDVYPFPDANQKDKISVYDYQTKNLITIQDQLKYLESIPHGKTHILADTDRHTDLSIIQTLLNLSFKTHYQNKEYFFYLLNIFTQTKIPEDHLHLVYLVHEPYTPDDYTKAKLIKYFTFTISKSDFIKLHTKPNLIQSNILNYYLDNGFGDYQTLSNITSYGSSSLPQFEYHFIIKELFQYHFSSYFYLLSSKNFIECINATDIKNIKHILTKPKPIGLNTYYIPFDNLTFHLEHNEHWYKQRNYPYTFTLVSSPYDFTHFLNVELHSTTKEHLNQILFTNTDVLESNYQYLYSLKSSLVNIIKPLSSSNIDFIHYYHFNNEEYNLYY